MLIACFDDDDELNLVANFYLLATEGSATDITLLIFFLRYENSRIENV